MSSPAQESAPRSLSRLQIALLIAAYLGICGLYLKGLGSVGLIGPDEPRYSFIARQMHESGDWITPYLWTEIDVQPARLAPWYEKPPLQYWLSALGYSAGWGDERAARMPIALFALGFLLIYWFALRRLEDASTATVATLILATSAGWLAFTQVAVTDIPLAASFSAAVLLALVRLQGGRFWLAPAAGFFFGLALLAKGLVPGVLVLPLLWFARKRWKEMLVVFAVALIVAGPWYGAMIARHGSAFIDEFFIKHHFSRFANDALKHQQPFWFYVPVLLGGLFPWISHIAGLRPSLWNTTSRRALAAVFLFGFIFFSASTNKLPGYLLPLWPSLCVLLAVGLRAAPDAARALTVSGLLISLAPLIGSVLPQAMLVGLSNTEIGNLPWEYVAAALPFAFAARWLARRGRLPAATAIVALGAGCGVIFIQHSAYPVLDELVTSRRLAQRVRPHLGRICMENVHRATRYGLNFYLRAPLPLCGDAPVAVKLSESPAGLPQIEPAVRPR